MAYPEVADSEKQTFQLTPDMIDLLVIVAELTEKHNSMSDKDAAKPVYKDVIKDLNRQINEKMHSYGFDLYEVRQRLELSIRQIIKARALAQNILHNLVDERI